MELNKAKYENQQLREMIRQRQEFGTKDELNRLKSRNQMLLSSNAALKDVLRGIRNSLGSTRFKLGAYQIYIGSFKARIRGLREELETCQRYTKQLSCQGCHVAYQASIHTVTATETH